MFPYIPGEAGPSVMDLQRTMYNKPAWAGIKSWYTVLKWKVVCVCLCVYNIMYAHVDVSILKGINKMKP